MDHFRMIKEISDGRLYGSKDIVRADAGGCRDCSRCCEDMCDTISLDPYDIYSLCKGLGKDYDSLIKEEYIVISLHNLVSMPHINDRGSGCGFLDEKNRCSVHKFRPGICRLFPLGRYYHDETVSYILQTYGCTKEERGEVRVCDWLEISDIDAYEEYILKWHDVVKKISDFMKEPAEPGVKPKIHESFLKHFYEQPYDFSKEFYPQIYDRIREWSENQPLQNRSMRLK